MEILCQKEPLAKAFRIVSSLTSHRGVSDGSQGILLEAQGDCLVVRASDGEVTASHRVNDAKIEKGDTVLVDPILGNLVVDMTEETVTLSLSQDGSTLFVKGKGKNYEVPTSNAYDFRGIEPGPGGVNMVFKSEILKSAVNHCAFAVAKEASRYAFHGIRIEADPKGEVDFIGSDGRRLSHVKSKTEETVASKVECLVPRRALSDFMKALPPDGETVMLTVSPSTMCLEMGNTTVLAQLIEGLYPDYKGVIPGETANRADILVSELEEALRRITLIASNDYPMAIMTFYQHGELEIKTAQGSKMGKESIDVKLEGPGGEMNLNPTFILEMLRHCDDDTVSLYFTDNKTPGMFKGDKNFTHIVMPVCL